MKKKVVFRIILAVLLLTFLGQSAFRINLMAHQTYLEHAGEVLGSEEAAMAQLKIAQLQLLVNICLIILVIPLFHSLVLRRLEKHRQWWFAFPIAIGLAVVLGVALAHLDRWLNPYYYFDYILESTVIRIDENFDKLKAINFINVFNVCLFTGLIYKVEELLFDNFASVKRRLQWVGSLFWLSLFFIIFIGGLIIFYESVTVTLDHFINLVPQNTIIAICATLVGLFFLDHFYHKGKIQIRSSFNEIFKFLFTALGFLGAASLIFFWKNGLLLVMNYIYVPIVMSALATIVVVCMVCYLLYLANVGGIRKGPGIQARLEQKVSELNFLKSQINPHFLFNSLNTVYSMALTENSPRTANGVQMLSEMMRFMLKENTEDFIPLDREIDYIHNYIELQSLRLKGSETELEVALDHGCTGKIAPMILVPFVENAFKHGVSIKDHSFIKIKLDCLPDGVALAVKNSKHQRELPENEESGLGLANVKERLEILYEGRHTLDIHEGDNTFEVRLKMNLI